MKQLKRISSVLMGCVLALPGLSDLTGTAPACYNQSFTSSKGPLDGWNIDYDWTGNEHQMGNQKNASFLPQFNGRKNVLKMSVPSGFETKVETPLIPYEAGDMYKCTFDIYIENVAVHALFQGYNLKPGIPPSEPAQMQNLRRMYKAEYVQEEKGGWRTVTVSIPNPQISTTAYRHLKKIRYITVLMYVPGDTYFKDGNFYISNVNVVKLPGKVTVSK